MSWSGLEAETWGMQKAWVNLRGDAAGMASYVYDRMSDYTGAGHPAVCEALLQRLIGIVAGETPVFDDAAGENLRTAVDRLRIEVDEIKASGRDSGA